MPTEVGHEGINPDAVDGLCVAMQGVELATPLGVTEVLPVGDLVANTVEARLFEGVSEILCLRRDSNLSGRESVAVHDRELIHRRLPFLCGSYFVGEDVA